MSGARLAASDVRTFMLVTVQAAPGQSVADRRTAVLLGDDVIDLEWQGVICAWHVAILATSTGPLTNLIDQFTLHNAHDSRVFSDFRAFDFKMPSTWPTWMK